MKRKWTFEQWMAAVDRFVFDKTGLGVGDMVDVNFRDMFDDGKTAEFAANKAMRESGVF